MLLFMLLTTFWLSVSLVAPPADHMMDLARIVSHEQTNGLVAPAPLAEEILTDDNSTAKTEAPNQVDFARFRKSSRVPIEAVIADLDAGYDPRVTKTLDRLAKSSAGEKLLRSMHGNNAKVSFDYKKRFGDPPSSIKPYYDTSGRVDGVLISLNDAWFNHPKTSEARRAAIMAGQNYSAGRIKRIIGENTARSRENVFPDADEFKEALRRVTTVPDLIVESVSRAQVYDRIHYRLMTNTTPLSPRDFENYLIITHGKTDNARLAREFEGDPLSIAVAKLATHALARLNVITDGKNRGVSEREQLKAIDELLNDNQYLRHSIEMLNSYSSLPAIPEETIQYVERLYRTILNDYKTKLLDSTLT